MDYVQLGRRIKAIRTEKNMTQEMIAEATGLSSQHISNTETGKTKISLSALVKVANCLQVSIDQLICESVVGDKNIISQEYVEILSQCSGKELALINEINQLIIKLIKK